MTELPNRAIRSAARAIYTTRGHGASCSGECVDHFAHDVTDAKRNALRDATAALRSALPHLTDDGAAAPAVTLSSAAEATSTAAPSSPHLSRERVLDLLHTTVFHCFDNEEFGLSAKHATAVTDALFDAELFREGATPAIDRDQIAAVLREHLWIPSESRCSCGDEHIEFVSHHQADAILALIGRAQ